MVGPTLGPTLGGWIVDNYSVAVDLLHQRAARHHRGVHGARVRARRGAPGARRRRSTSSGILLLALVRRVRCSGCSSAASATTGSIRRFVTSLAITSAVVAHAARLARTPTIDEPVIDFRVLKSRQLAAGVTFAAFMGLALYGSVFVLPIFLQSLHGFTAKQTGRVILPGAIASAVTMAVRRPERREARRARHGDRSARSSSSGPCTSCPSHDRRRRGRPVLAAHPARRGARPDLRAAHQRDDGRPQADRNLPQGTGMFNLTRQLGGSLGIAIMATLLTRFTVVGEIAPLGARRERRSAGRRAPHRHGARARGARLDPAQAQQRRSRSWTARCRHRRACSRSPRSTCSAAFCCRGAAGAAALPHRQVEAQRRPGALTPALTRTAVPPYHHRHDRSTAIPGRRPGDRP